jgi:hypothetical protein
MVSSAYAIIRRVSTYKPSGWMELLGLKAGDLDGG